MSFLGKMRDWMGIEEVDDEITEEEITAASKQLERDLGDSKYNASLQRVKERELLKEKVVPINSTKATNPFKLMITEPESFDDCPKLVDSLKARKPVILNLDSIDSDTARKIFDFMSGATYALNGNVQPVTNNIFVFAPENVDITANVQNSGFDYGDASNKIWR